MSYLGEHSENKILCEQDCEREERFILKVTGAGEGHRGRRSRTDKPNGYIYLFIFYIVLPRMALCYSIKHINESMR